MSTKNAPKEFIVTSTGRRLFTHGKDILEMPDLIEMQKDSYKWFVKEGLAELFDEISPITDFIGRDLELYFEEYYLDEPKFDEKQSRAKKYHLRSSLARQNSSSEQKNERRNFAGSFSWAISFDDRERNFHRQRHWKSCGFSIIKKRGRYFFREFAKGKKYYGAKIIPNRGAWLEIETDANKVIWVRIDRKRKIAFTSLLRAFGIATDDAIRDLFKDIDVVRKGEDEMTHVDATIAKDAAHNEEEGLEEVYNKRKSPRAIWPSGKCQVFDLFDVLPFWPLWFRPRWSL